MQEVTKNSLIFVKTKALNKELCDKIIANFKKDTNAQEAGTTARGLDKKLKDSIDLHISNQLPNWKNFWQEIDQQIFEHIQSAYQEYKAIMEPMLDVGVNDSGYFVRHYPKGQGKYGWHADAISPNTLTRVVSGIIYLNDVTNGGETEFRYHDVKVKPEAGKILFFPSFWTHTHRGTVPVSNDKTIITTFFNLAGPGYEQYARF